MAQKTKVAILGGGMGSLAAAVALTDPEVRDRYDVTVYQQGWRLGGKGASSREPNANHRIEEHGLHALGGYYENAFRVLERCYREIGGSWKEHFLPQSNITWPDLFHGDWFFEPTQIDETPGEWPGEGTHPPPPAALVCKMLPSLRKRLADALDIVPADRKVDDDSIFGDEPILLRVARGIIGASPRERLLQALDDVLRLIDAGRQELCTKALENPATADGVALALRVFRRLFRELHSPDRFDGPEAQRLFVQVDFGVTTLVGMIRDGVLHKGFDAVDDYDFRAWLARHGAHQVTLDSRTVHSLYDYGFSYVDGDPGRPAFAASVALRVFLRFMVASRGAVQWKMRSGMGEAVFLPMYRALVKRGVKFRFFHRVTALRCDAKAIRQIELVRQVRLKGGADYDPIVEDAQVGEYWPPEPRYEQIDDHHAALLQQMKAASGHDLETNDLAGETQPLVLRAGADFEVAVLGISLGAFPTICADLINEKQTWRDLVRHVLTVRTQSFQAWLTPTMAEIGWAPPPPTKDRPTFTVGHEDPFNTWADMTHLIGVEKWPGGERPGALLYFCGPMRDSDDARTPHAGRTQVQRNARAWLAAFAGKPWPLGVPRDNPRGLDLAKLAAPAGADRFDAQYFRANTAPSERYVLSPPGSARHRLAAGDSGFGNLVLAGDWVRTGVNFGCMEAAAMSGLQASRAISQHPQEIYGERDLPEEP